jgi:hypothetical protein
MTHITLAAALLLAVQRPAGDTSLDERIRRLDSLVASRMAEIRAERQRSMATGRLVELRVGGYVLEVEPQLTALAREAARSAWARMQVRGGSWLSRELPRLTMTMYQMETQRGPLGSTRREIVVDAGLPVNSAASAPWWEGQTGLSASTTAGDAAAVEGVLVGLAERFAYRATDDDLRDWLRVTTGTRSYADEQKLNLTANPEDWRATRRDLAVVTSRTNRACVDGAIAGCLSSLGIGNSAEPATSVWYAPEDYKWLAASVGYSSRDTTMRALHDSCARTGDASLCERFVHRAWNGHPWRPLGVTPRATLLGLVLEHGGAGALDRLLASRGSPAERLAAAAGGSLDAPAAIWQARVVSTAPNALRSAHWSWLLALALSASGIALAGRGRVS